MIGKWIGFCEDRSCRWCKVNRFIWWMTVYAAVLGLAAWAIGL